MSRRERSPERAPASRGAADPGRAPYAPPCLRRYGSLLELTRADQHNAGTPDGAFKFAGAKVFVLKSL